MRWKAEIVFPPGNDEATAVWERWFAWHPVQVYGEWVWLEFVRRRFMACIWDYTNA
jgi:hypothetical protein